MTIAELRAHQEDGTMTARAIVDGYLERIAKEDGSIGAFLEVFEADARIAADEIDRKRAAGEPLGPLAGVPIAVKDNILVEGHIASSASHLLEHYRAAYSATAVERLRAADAIIIGRTNMDEFACGSSTETGAFGVTKNPRDKERVPGGTSGGSAAAVAAGFVPVALGSDTGGSVRQPSALCGVTGLKPSYGAVSRYGLMAAVSSFDQIGPIANCVEDLAEVHRVIAGADPHDMTTHDQETAMPELGPIDMKGKRVGVPKQFFNDALDPMIAKTVQTAIDAYAHGGAEIVPLDLPMLEHALAAFYVIQPAELSSNLNRYDGIEYGAQAQGATLQEQIVATRSQGFGDEVQRRIMLGSFVLSAGYMDAYYKKAVAVRQALREELENAFEIVDVIAGPTSPTTAWKIGEKFDDPLTMYLADIYTVVANLATVPAVSVPCGDVEGLPVGLQLMAAHGQDTFLLDAAYWYQQFTA